MTSPPRIFDSALHRRRLERAGASFARAGFLKARVGEDFVVRLGALRRDFALAVDLAARDGTFAAAARSELPAGKIGRLIESDLSLAMIEGRSGARLVADAEALPLAEASVDLIVSGLALHWTNDLVGALIQIRRALRPDGLFLGALFGGATLMELREVLVAAEAEAAGGVGPRVSPFLDPYDAPGLLQRAGFAEPVVDTDKVAVRYDHAMALLADLRAMGETNALAERSSRPLSRRTLALAADLYAQRYAAADGRITATFEIITLTGWGRAEGPSRRGEDITHSQSRSQATRGSSAGGMG